MKVAKSDLIRWSPELAEEFHIWEVVIPFVQDGKLQIRQEKFMPKDYETPEDQYEEVCDVINGCRFSATEYHVFCDDRLVTNF